MYAHQETTTVGGSSYYQNKLISADTAGSSLSVSMTTTGRQLWGKFVYPFTGVSSIPASSWAISYRTWRDSNPSITFDAGNSYTGSTSQLTHSWTHTTANQPARLLIVGISITTTGTSTPTTVSSVTYAGAAMAQINTAYYGTDPRVRTYLYYLTSPAIGPNTVSVTLANSLQ